MIGSYLPTGGRLILLKRYKQTLYEQIEVKTRL